ncbi:transcriptional regulator [Xylanibacillus composti]|uniref:GTP cyclohydrolase 1 type 2 homolog n=1 Tax=Xylanibacillus composti TaxID=1572762 RepID=A0A8J4H715_9BACL|nr:Nif3-like dinuclear metal center hexameric protein [Xylanibacillus composti]MDT9724013.1 transcriptional regulator [Xylanibacillus composti]GIQ71081.1 GTP cyclohydrolase 1 type 2 [Xylanibacillus composti]
MKTTISQVMRALTEPVGVLEPTVDTLKYGDPEAEVTGIVTTFMPTQAVLEEAVELGANLIVAHEGPFFSHQDSFVQALKQDPVYLAKDACIREAGLALFRFHDYWHRYQPDGIMEGLLEALAWSDRAVRHEAVASVVQLPPVTVREIAQYVKRQLGLSYVRVTGGLDQTCERIGLLAGYRGGGEHAIPLFEREQLDLVVYGEGPEWETPEYVRDAVRQGRGKALIVLGHAESEAAGMKLLADRLQTRFPDVPVHFAANPPIFQVL